MGRSMVRDIIELGKIVVGRRRPMSSHQALRDRRLRAVVRNAYEHVPYYRDRFRAAGISPEDIRSADDLHKVPVTTKDDLRAAGMANTISRRVDVSGCIMRTTSGSTGKPFAVFRTRSEERTRLQFQMAALLTAGLRPLDRFVMLIAEWEAPRRLHTRLGLFQREVVRVSRPIEEQIRRLRELRPTVLWTWPSALRSLMHFVEGPFREVVNPRILITNAEILDPHLRNRVKTELDTELFNFYGACEFGRIAWECKAHEGLHINGDHLIVECVDGDLNPLPFNHTGTIVVTSLYSFAMPFIRYNLNDLGMLKEAKCSCGSPLPLMAPPMGRETEVLRLPSGRIMPPLELLNLMSSFNKVDQFRFVQEATDLLRVELVMREGRDPSTEETVRTKIRDYLKEPVRVEVVTKKDPSVSSSKFRVIVSNGGSRRSTP
ncbi:MAG: hypothetical protein RDU20_05690 [Desulfomonilaceae bacterium]|nr:hypothetical protein [Desulfomonilaceae bacterium]